MTAPTLMEKLSLIQCELKAPKNQYNQFGNYYYRSCEDILEAVKPLCNKQKTTLIISDEIVCVDGWHYIKAIARLHDWESGEVIENIAYARESATKKGMDDSQVTGSTSTYARKYALNGLFNIDDTKDNDSPDLKKEQTEKAKKEEPKQGNERKGMSGSDRKKITDRINSNIVVLQNNYHTNINDESFKKYVMQKARISSLDFTGLSDVELTRYDAVICEILKVKEQSNGS